MYSLPKAIGPCLASQGRDSWLGQPQRQPLSRASRVAIPHRSLLLTEPLASGICVQEEDVAPGQGLAWGLPPAPLNQ